MEISWQGNNTVTAKGNKTRVVVNPTSEQLAGDDVFIFNEEQTKKGDKQIFDWPGEYEVKGVPIVSLAAWTKPKGEEGAKPNNVIKFEVDGIKFCHLGNLGHELSSDMIEKIGNIDVLIVAVNGNLSTKKLHAILEEMEPRAVMPVDCADIDAFLKEMGVPKPEVSKSYTIKTSAQFGEEKREYILLEQS